MSFFKKKSNDTSDVHQRWNSILCYKQQSDKPHTPNGEWKKQNTK